jgi:hypothetical protein
VAAFDEVELTNALTLLTDGYYSYGNNKKYEYKVEWYDTTDGSFPYATADSTVTSTSVDFISGQGTTADRTVSGGSKYIYDFIYRNYNYIDSNGIAQDRNQGWERLIGAVVARDNDNDGRSYTDLAALSENSDGTVSVRDVNAQSTKSETFITQLKGSFNNGESFASGARLLVGYDDSTNPQEVTIMTNSSTVFYYVTPGTGVNRNNLTVVQKVGYSNSLNVTAGNVHAAYAAVTSTSNYATNVANVYPVADVVVIELSKAAQNTQTAFVYSVDSRLSNNIRYLSSIYSGAEKVYNVGTPDNDWLAGQYSDIANMPLTFQTLTLEDDKVVNAVKVTGDDYTSKGIYADRVEAVNKLVNGDDGDYVVLTQGRVTQTNGKTLSTAGNVPVITFTYDARSNTYTANTEADLVAGDLIIYVLSGTSTSYIINVTGTYRANNPSARARVARTGGVVTDAATDTAINTAYANGTLDVATTNLVDLWDEIAEAYYTNVISNPTTDVVDNRTAQEKYDAAKAVYESEDPSEDDLKDALADMKSLTTAELEAIDGAQKLLNDLQAAVDAIDATAAAATLLSDYEAYTTATGADKAAALNKVYADAANLLEKNGKAPTTEDGFSADEVLAYTQAKAEADEIIDPFTDNVGETNTLARFKLAVAAYDSLNADAAKIATNAADYEGDLTKYAELLPLYNKAKALVDAYNAYTTVSADNKATQNQKDAALASLRNVAATISEDDNTKITSAFTDHSSENVIADSSASYDAAYTAVTETLVAKNGKITLGVKSDATADTIWDAENNILYVANASEATSESIAAILENTESGAEALSWTKKSGTEDQWTATVKGENGGTDATVTITVKTVTAQAKLDADLAAVEAALEAADLEVKSNNLSLSAVKTAIIALISNDDSNGLIDSASAPANSSTIDKTEGGATTENVGKGIVVAWTGTGDWDVPNRLTATGSSTTREFKITVYLTNGQDQNAVSGSVDVTVNVSIEKAEAIR